MNYSTFLCFCFQADKDQNGVIDFPEFVEMMKIQSASADNDEVKEAFELFDKNGDGSLSTAELRYMMASHGRRMTDAEIDEMIEVADADGNKQIDYNVSFLHFSRSNMILLSNSIL